MKADEKAAAALGHFGAPYPPELGAPPHELSTTKTSTKPGNIARASDTMSLTSPLYRYWFNPALAALDVYADFARDAPDTQESTAGLRILNLLHTKQTVG